MEVPAEPYLGQQTLDSYTLVGKGMGMLDLLEE